MLNAKEFSRKYAETYGVTYKYAAMICQSVFDLLGETLYDEKEDVVIRGFGSFRHKKVAGRAVRIPLTDTMVTIPDRNIIKFSPSDAAYNNT